MYIKKSITMEAFHKPKIFILISVLLMALLFPAIAKKAMAATPAVAAGESHSVLLMADGTLWTWGDNTYGQLGDGTTTFKLTPVQITGSWIAVAAGQYHTVAIKSDGSLWSWGNNTYGQLGDNSLIQRNSPVQIGIATTWTAVSAGAYHSVALQTNDLYAWGRNIAGQLGDGTGADKLIPTFISGGWTSVSAGFNFTIGLQTDGTVWGWGDNFSGQLGDGTGGTSRLAPVKEFSNSNTWSAISAGNSHTVALKSNGTLWTWGSNSDGQTGTGNGSLTPTQVGVAIDWTAIAAGSFHTLAKKTSGALYAWGNNAYGEIGDNTTTQRNTPVQIGTDTTWTAMAGGWQFTLGMTGTSVWAWGANDKNQLGDGTRTQRNSPVRLAPYISITPSSGAFGNVKTGQATTQTFVIVNTGSFALNIGTLNLLGPDYLQFSIPADTCSSQSLVPGANCSVTLSLTPSGTGAINATLAIPSNDPVAPTANIALTATGTSYKLLVNKTGKGTVKGAGIKCGTDCAEGVNVSDSVSLSAVPDPGFIFSGWGGACLGTSTCNLTIAGDTTVSATFVAPSSPAIVAINAGFNHSFAIKTDGTLWAWGNNGYGRLGDGTTNSTSSPIKIGSSTWSAVSGSQSHTLAIRSDGTLWAWGGNSNNQLGDGTTTQSTVPKQIGVATNWAAVAAGSMHSLAIKADGTLWAWGYNGYGQLGDGTMTNRTTPVQIGIDIRWKAIAVGSSTSYGLKSDGTIWAWGYNYYGQLGDGTSGNNTDKSIPTLIGWNTDWTAIAAGQYHALALQADGTLWAWGYNNYGQLGDNSNTTRTTPTKINNDTDWVSIASGQNHSLAIKANGTLLAWGYNSYGQLGDGTTTNRNFPLQVGSGTNWHTITGGIYDTLALTADGLLWAWGYNGSGELGDGTTTNKTSPGLIAQNISISPASNNFGSITVGNSSAATSFTVSNNGSFDLFIGAISLTGTNPSDFTITSNTCSNQTIVTGGYCSVSVLFAPLSGGAKSASLSVPSNDPDNLTATVALSGTGFVSDSTPPTVSAGPDIITASTITLTATASDTSSMTYLWTKMSGPGTLIFGSPSALSTTVSALFDGTYIVRFTATDAAGNSAYSDMTFVWDTTAPKIGGAKYIKEWGSSGTGNGQFDGLYGMAADGSGNVYVTDWVNDRIQKFDSNGTYLTQWGSPGSGSGQFDGPLGVAVDLSGEIYVTDYNNNRIQKFDSNGTYLSQCGSAGTGNGQLAGPYGITIDIAGNIYIADAGNNRIQKFDSNCSYLTQWGSLGTGAGQFDTPTGVAVDASGNVYVTDYYNNRIQKFSSAGTYLTQWGSYGTGNGQFYYPNGLAVGPSGTIYIADGNNNRIQQFSPDGTYLNQWGSDGTGIGQFDGPYELTTDASGYVYVADFSNNRVQKFYPWPATSSNPNGTYSVGSAINVSILFTEPISSSGLTINLNSGASISTGPISNVTDWSGTYTVSAGQSTPALNINSITGTITDAAGNPTVNPAVPAGLNIADHKAIAIFTTGPVVSAGPNVTANATFTQTATAASSKSMTYLWTKQSGPGMITFGSPNALSTTITASIEGTYIIRFTATDSLGNSAYSEMTLVWESQTYTLSVSKSGNGSIVSIPSGINCGTDCVKSYNQEQALTLTAKADAGYLFAGWSGCDKASGSYRTLEMNSDRTVTANFEKNASGITPPQPGETIDFETVKVGKLKNKTYKITNSGKGYLTISAHITGDNADMFGVKLGGKKTIKPKGVYGLTLMFKPKSAGNKSATLKITTSDPDNPSFEITLKGTGILKAGATKTVKPN